MFVILLNAANTPVVLGNVFLVLQEFGETWLKRNFIVSNQCIKDLNRFRFLTLKPLVYFIYSQTVFIYSQPLFFAISKSIHKWSNSFSTQKQFFRILLWPLLVISGVFKKMTCVKNVKYDLPVLRTTKLSYTNITSEKWSKFVSFFSGKTWKIYLCANHLIRMASGLRMSLGPTYGEAF